MDTLTELEKNDVQEGVGQSSRMGDALITHAKLKPQDVDRILALQKEKNILFGEAAKQLNLITDADIKKALSLQFDYPYIIHDGKLEGSGDKLSELLLAAHQPFSKDVEKLRSLRSQLLMKWFDHGNKILAVASVNEVDGASATIANLAIVFSQMNKKTLLIDANLRHSAQHRLFNVKSKLGLANILANRPGNYAITRNEAMPNLYLLTAGTEVPNPQELLSKQGFSELLVDLEKIYDIILIDTAPLSYGSDLLTVVSKAKAVFVVARKDATLAADLQSLMEHINMTGANTLGAVLQSGSIE